MPTPSTTAAVTCKGCDRPMLPDNAWMLDGCPCNSELGVNDNMACVKCNQIRQSGECSCVTNSAGETKPGSVPAFAGVEFRREYPGANVADHEAFLSFTNDGDCCKFHEWWFVAGAQAFADWLAKPQAEASP